MTDFAPQVLIIADEITARPLYAEAMKNALNATISFVGDQTTALARLSSEQPPDILLIDHEFDQQASREILANIKSDHRLRYTPIVILTAADDAKQQLHLLDLGADDFIEKTAPREVLIARLKTQWRHKLAIERFERTAFDRDLFAAGVLQDISGIKWTIISLCRQAKEKLQLDANAHQSEIQDCLRKLEDYGAKVGRYAYDIIQSVRETQRPPTVESQNIRDHVEWVTDILACGDDSGALRISWELPPHLLPVRGDRNYLKLVLLNIAQHILDYNGKDSHYVVRISQDRHTSLPDNLRILFEIANKTMAQANLSSLFQPYGRGFGDAHTGLGLSLIAKVMVKMNGRAAAHATADGQGVVYTIELPQG